MNPLNKKNHLACVFHLGMKLEIESISLRNQISILLEEASIRMPSIVKGEQKEFCMQIV